MLTGSQAASRSSIDAFPAELGRTTGCRRHARRRGAAFAGRDVGAAARAGGFSMLEVLVAFVILALVGTALFRLFSGALTNAAAAEDYSRAVLVATSVLAEAAATPPLREGSQTGTTEDGRIEWTTRVALYKPPEVNPDTELGSELMPTRLWRVAADVTFTGPNGKPRTLTLATMRIGMKDAQ
jgi:general secretion pathway protein I